MEGGSLIRPDHTGYLLDLKVVRGREQDALLLFYSDPCTFVCPTAYANTP